MRDEKLETNRKNKNLQNQIKICEAAIRLHQSKACDMMHTEHSRWHHQRMLEVETKKLTDLLDKLNKLEG